MTYLNYSIRKVWTRVNRLGWLKVGPVPEVVLLYAVHIPAEKESSVKYKVSA